MDVFTAQFKKYLKTPRLVGKKLSANSVKNYMADLRAFFRWLKSATNHQLTIKDLTPQAFQAYCNRLTQKNTPASTLRRRLATLRKFGQFLVKENYLGKSPLGGLKNPTPTPQVHQILKQFKRYLKSTKLSKSTVKNYMADVSQFCQWAKGVA